MGMGFGFVAIGVLVGTPITGQILTASGNFKYIWIYGGAMMVIGSVFVGLARFAHSHWVWWVKV